MSGDITTGAALTTNQQGLNASDFNALVNTATLNEGVVTASKLAANAVTNSKIAALAVTADKMENIADQTLVGNNGGSTGSRQAIAISAVKTMLSLGDAAYKNTGTSAGTLAAGDDSRFSTPLQKASNLSDLADVSTARTNLGLDTAATQSYSEGTWTPTLVSSGGGDGSRTYTVQNGRYVKIGKLVHLQGVVQINAVSTIGTGIATIAGLPYACESTYSAAGSIGYYVNGAQGLYDVGCHVHQGDNVIRLTGNTSGSTSILNNLTPAQVFANNLQIIFSITYKTT